MNNYYQPYINPNYGINTYQYQQPQVICKVVESEDSARTSEVPFGGIGIFPKADQSVVYIKRWNLDASTDVLSYYPTNTEHEETVSSISQALTELNDKIDSLSKRSKREVYDYE